MPSLAGLFGRKKKPGPAANAAPDFESVASSPTAEYVTPDKSLPSSPNGRSNLPPRLDFGDQPSSIYPSVVANNHKLRLPFGRKKPSAAVSSTSVVTPDDEKFGSPPRPQYLSSPRNSTSTSSDTDVDFRRLRPPPSKSAIFAAYGDPHGALSTRSLPSSPTPGQQTTPIVPPVPPPKKSTFLNWSRPSPKSTPPVPRPGLVPTQPSNADSSFNLKSFRHISSSPNAPSRNASNGSLLLPPAIPRPRGSSVASDTSHRISVAAFREAARRSTAGSPVPPGSRAPSPLSSGTLRPGQIPYLSHRRSELAYASDSDDQQSFDEDSDDDDSSPHKRHSRQGASVMRRQRTLTQRQDNDKTFRGRATKSELGHGSGSSHRDFEPAQRPKSNFGFMSQDPASRDGSTRQRASLSTSAISPTAAAKRASVITTANGKGHVRVSSTQSNPAGPFEFNGAPGGFSGRPRAPSASSSDSDDTPLATLVPPRRPGSAMSSANGSTRSLNAPPKPLIDINQLTKSRPVASGRPSHEGFTPGNTLLGGRGPIVSSPVSVAPSPMFKAPIPTSVDPPRKFVSPPSSPTKAYKHLTPSDVPAAEPVAVPTRRETSPEGAKRDMFGERLNRVVQMKTGMRSSGAVSSSTGTPSPTPMIPSSSSPKPRPAPPPMSPPMSRIASPTQQKMSLPPNTNPSPPDEDLASMLGGGISLISRTGESQSSESGGSSDEDSEDPRPAAPTKQESARIAPIPIKQRTPAPSFSVTSRPPLRRPTDENGRPAMGSDVMSVRSSVFSITSASTVDVPLSSAKGTNSGQRQRSATMIPSSQPTSGPANAKQPAGKKGGIPRDGWNSTSTSNSNSNSTTPSSNSSEKSDVAVKGRPRSSTMLPSFPSPTGPVMPPTLPPNRPFAGRRDSPASSTGDSSSGRGPFTPKDGSDIGVGARRRPAKDEGKEKEWSSGVSGLGVGGRHFKRRSVSFEEDLRIPESGGGGAKKDAQGDEERRRERRRSEAKAAIELGNVINGPGPTVSDDDDDDLPINQTLTGGPRMSMLNPMIGMNMGPMGFSSGMPASWSGLGMAGNMNGWPPQQMPQNPQLLSPAQFMPALPADPGMVAAHQQAMMIAKQAYQIAVAQQAAMAAGDEWERSSNIGGMGSTSGSVYGGGGGGGGGGGPSMIGSPYGMMGMGMGMPGMGMPGNGWSTGSVIFPDSSRSAYGGISGARSEYGGGGRSGGQWSSSKSSYGESFGPSNRHSKMRDSGYFPPIPPIPQSKNGGSGQASSPRSRTASQPATPPRGARRAPPPSSWKAGV